LWTNQLVFFTSGQFKNWECTDNVPNIDPCKYPGSWTGVNCQIVPDQLPDSNVIPDDTDENSYAGKSYIDSIEFDDITLVGLPDIEPSFPYTRAFSLYHTNFETVTNNIPDSLCLIPALSIIGYSGNAKNITGKLPNCYTDPNGNLGIIKSNTYLEITGFDGLDLPDAFSDDLQYLDISNNKINGVNFVDKDKNFPYLTFMNLIGNTFIGALPFMTLGSPMLETFMAVNTGFSGELPSTISPKITTLYLGYNDISGEIPTTWGKLKSLTTINLMNNALEGVIPDSLCGSPLASANFQNNVFTEIPLCLTAKLGDSLVYDTNTVTIVDTGYGDSDDLSTGAIIGIVAGGIVGLALIVYLIRRFYCGAPDPSVKKPLSGAPTSNPMV